MCDVIEHLYLRGGPLSQVGVAAYFEGKHDFILLEKNAF